MSLIYENDLLKALLKVGTESIQKEANAFVK